MKGGLPQLCTAAGASSCTAARIAAGATSLATYQRGEVKGAVVTQLRRVWRRACGSKLRLDCGRSLFLRLSVCAGGGGTNHLAWLQQCNCGIAIASIQVWLGRTQAANILVTSSASAWRPCLH